MRHGVHLTRTQYANLLEILDEINSTVNEFRGKTVESFRYAIGDGMCVAAISGFPVIHIRRYDGVSPFIRPSYFGIGLRFQEWDTFVNLAGEVRQRIELI